MPDNRELQVQRVVALVARALLATDPVQERILINQSADAFIARCPSVIESLALRVVPVRVRDLLVRDAAVGRERQGRRIGRAQVQRHAEFGGFGSMLTTVASRNKSRV